MRVAGRAGGFTLIELIITLALLALLATLTIPLAQLATQRTREQELHAALREIRGAIDAYQRASAEGRIARPIGSNGYPPTLDTLVDGVEDQRDPRRSKIYFLRRIPRDPFNPDTQSAASETWAKRCYRSDANDPQEGDDVYDVYSRSVEVGLNGIPYQQW